LLRVLIKIFDTIGGAMNLSNSLMILAVLFSPFLAVFVQRKIDLNREKRGHKLWIFRTLMATRGNKISLEHVQALNSIELFFDNPKKDKNIVEKWNEYLDHLVGQNLKPEDKDYSAKLSAWVEKSDDLLAELLQIMGKSLGYDFDKVKIKRGIYVPRGHGEEMGDQFIIRKGLVNILSGKASLSVEVKNK
jgi:hypothetical protein